LRALTEGELLGVGRGEVELVDHDAGRREVANISLET
jgi:hypothetical protein